MKKPGYRIEGLLQVARPDGNTFERWKWRHRYFIWTWSLSGAAICLVRSALNPAHPEWHLLSWFTLSSYLLALPVAVILGAMTLLVLWFLHRDWTTYPGLGYKGFTVFAWTLSILALLFVAALLVRVFLRY